jgi:hypothetical protein
VRKRITLDLRITLTECSEEVELATKGCFLGAWRVRDQMAACEDWPKTELPAAYFVMIAAWAGEKDLAVQQFGTATPKPGAAIITSYRVLKLLPFWDPLRGDPRFEKIVASFAPKK